MKAYGKSKRNTAVRKIRGTSMACPCCIPNRRANTTKVYKKTARQEGKKIAAERAEQ